jgi:hypothetical protein
MSAETGLSPKCLAPSSVFEHGLVGIHRWAAKPPIVDGAWGRGDLAAVNALEGRATLFAPPSTIGPPPNLL